MPEKNPITDALLQLYENQASVRQAELDLERARTKKEVHARGVVSGVFAQLQEQKMKREAQQERIAKAQSREQEQVPMQAMVPPTVDVTGQTAGRDPAASLKAASEIASIVSGGGGLRRAGAVPGQTPGVGQGIVPGAVATGMGAATAAGQAAASQVGSQQAAQAGAPAPSTVGGTQVVTQPTPWWQRAIEIGGGIAARSPALVVKGIRGEEIVGTQPLESEAEKSERQFNESAQEAAALAPLLREAQEQQGKPGAGDAGKRISAHIEDIAKRRGGEVAHGAVRIAEAKMLEMQQEERERLRRAITSSGLVAERQAQGRAEREAMRMGRPSEQARDQEATFQRDIAAGKPTSTFGGQTYTAEQRRVFLDERARTSFETRMMNDVIQSLRGHGIDPAAIEGAPVMTQEAVDKVAKELGTEDPNAIRRELERRGYRAP